MGSNHALVSQGFRVLLRSFAPYIARELGNEFGDNWWTDGVINILYDDQKRDLPLTGDWPKLVDSLDVARCLLLFNVHWHRVFRKKLSIDHRTWSNELIGVRNRLAHLGGKDFPPDDTWRALDTMSRLIEQIDPEGVEEIRSLLRASRYGSENGSTAVTVAPETPTAKRKKPGIMSNTPTSGLPGWRAVIEPHPDVARGRYKKAEFAADLAQVARGEGAYEYRDPVEFFARTYVTAGMTGLLEQALRRVGGGDGDPVIQLKTAFGGGKTHSMLALYHMMRGRIAVDKLPNVKPVLERVGMTDLPKANVAVLVGTALDPTRSKRPPNMPGITINTLWGEMAAQIAAAAGQPDLYRYVKEADKKGVSPGSEVLKNLFDAAAPCLILVDELVNYAKKLYGARRLPAGTFDNLVAFVQELTEAARASKNSLVVASIPESDIEIGGEAGRAVLETIEHTFGRMESIWKPVAAHEGFEVVRRRLFLDCKDTDGRDAVCKAFSQMYAQHQNDFPLETKELEYKERMTACYPIHPEVFDRLYEDWATLERFQRTRGVLRLMAAVIHELWMGNDAGLMIMPGSIPLDIPNVRDELTRHLSEGWNAVVDREVDGKNSIPYQTDQANPRYGGNLAARRVSRTVMLGSAPTVRDQRVRGIEAARIRLGIVQPGENIAIFNDARNTLQTSLAYLYTNSSGTRFWYDTRPTLRKTVEDRATQVPASDVEYEIETRLRGLRKEKPFGGVHICPASSLDVPDEQDARLVILGPADQYKASRPDNRAMTAVKDFLSNRGNAPRIYRNMLAFVAPDQGLMGSLEQAVRLYLAWKSIQDESEELNLDAAQNRETENNLGRSNRTVDARIKETYCWLITPYIDKSVDLKTVIWDAANIGGGGESIILKVAKKMLQNEAIITRWAPALLKMELDNLLWRESNHIAIKKLWEYLCTYCYLPRLAGEKVLEDTIRAGVNAAEYYAFASGFDGERYMGLRLDQYVDVIEHSGYLVKLDVARRQLEAEAAERQEPGGVTIPPPGGTGPGPVYPSIGRNETDTDTGKEPPGPSKVTRFRMSAALDVTRSVRDMRQFMDEVVNHLSSEDGTKVKMVLEVEVDAPTGLSSDTVQVVSENCRTLKVKDFSFDE